MSFDLYYIRYLPKGQSGIGELLDVISAPEGTTLKHLKDTYPSMFERSGFYTLMKATGEGFNVH